MPVSPPRTPCPAGPANLSTVSTDCRPSLAAFSPADATTSNPTTQDSKTRTLILNSSLPLYPHLTTNPVSPFSFYLLALFTFFRRKSLPSSLDNHELHTRYSSFLLSLFLLRFPQSVLHKPHQRFLHKTQVLSLKPCGYGGLCCKPGQKL